MTGTEKNEAAPAKRGIAWRPLAGLFLLIALIASQLNREPSKPKTEAGTDRPPQAATSPPPRQPQVDAQQSTYRDMSVEDFIVDGRELSARSAKVSISGVYLREGNNDIIYANVVAVASSRYRNQPHVGLLVDNASRELRRQLLNCQSDYRTAQNGCRATVFGRATTCAIGFGRRTEPCLDVDGGNAGGFYSLLPNGERL